MMDGQLNEQQLQLVEQYSESVIKTVMRDYSRRYGYGYFSEENYNDLYQEGCLAVVKAALGYREGNEASFFTYAYRAVYFALLNAFKKEWGVKNSEKNFCDFGDDEDVNEKNALEACLYRAGGYSRLATDFAEEQNEALEGLLSAIPLTAREKEMVEALYQPEADGKRPTKRAVAARYGVTLAQLNKLCKKYLELLTAA